MSASPNQTTPYFAKVASVGPKFRTVTCQNTTFRVCVSYTCEGLTFANQYVGRSRWEPIALTANSVQRFTNTAGLTWSAIRDPWRGGEVNMGWTPIMNLGGYNPERNYFKPGGRKSCVF